jgi:protein TonB
MGSSGLEMTMYDGVENATDWLESGVLNHKGPSPVRYPPLNVVPVSVCGPEIAPPIRYPILNVVPVSVVAREAQPPVRYPVFDLAPFEALRASPPDVCMDPPLLPGASATRPAHGHSTSPITLMGRGISFGLHASVIALIANLTPPEAPGAQGQEPDAISVNMVPTTVLDAIEEKVSEPEAAPAPVAELKPEDVKPEEPEHDQPKPLDAQPFTAQTLTTASAEAEAVAPQVEEKPVEKEQAQETKKEPKKEPPKKKPPKKKKQAVSGKKPGGRSGAVSASPGSISTYSAMVRARIARHRPGAGQQRGTAMVSFAISGRGGLVYARVTHSSGNSSIDAIAVQAVRSAAPFPPPPGGQRLNMAIPFYFR